MPKPSAEGKKPEKKSGSSSNTQQQQQQQSVPLFDISGSSRQASSEHEDHHEEAVSRIPQENGPLNPAAAPLFSISGGSSNNHRPSPTSSQDTTTTGTSRQNQTTAPLFSIPTATSSSSAPNNNNNQRQSSTQPNPDAAAAAPLFETNRSLQQQSSAQPAPDPSSSSSTTTTAPLFSLAGSSGGPSSTSSTAAASPLFNISASGQRNNSQQPSGEAPLFDISSTSQQQQGTQQQQQQSEPSNSATAAAPLFSIASSSSSGQNNNNNNKSEAKPNADSGAPEGNRRATSEQQQQQQQQQPDATAGAPLFNNLAAQGGSGNPLFKIATKPASETQPNVAATTKPSSLFNKSGPPLFNTSSSAAAGQQSQATIPTAAISSLFNLGGGGGGSQGSSNSSSQPTPLQRQTPSQQPAVAAPLFNIAAAAAAQQQNNSSSSDSAQSPAEDQDAAADAATTTTYKQDGKTGWLVSSCDVGTAEPQSLSQELERLQVLKSYHVLDPERDESFDRITTMASRVFGTPFTFVSLVDMGRIWFRCNPESEGEVQFTRDTLSCCSRVILKQSGVFVIPDTSEDELYRQSDANSGPVQFRFFAGAPLLSPEGYRLGAICMLGAEPRAEGLTEDERTTLKDFSDLAVKTMVDRRKLTTQGNPSHLVAATAHDLITPLTGIQLSLSLLQQDSDFQKKLGDNRKEFISAAVRSSNMMLRICQSTIETLRGNRKLSNVNDWSLPRNLMQIAESSPFIDMRDFVTNLEVISNSIPKRVPLKISLHPDAPTNIISDGLKIFRSALNVLSNACSRTETGSINFTIYDDQEGSLVFECEDTGKDISALDGQTLFSQDTDASNFGLYSVAYQINWLGGKYGYRKREVETEEDEEDSKPQAQGAREEGKIQNGNNSQGSLFWFSIPIVLPQDVSELMGLARSLTEQNNDDDPISQSHLPLTPPASPQIEENQYQESPAADDDEGSKNERRRKTKALIIEDSSVVRKILARALSKLDYQVHEAVDGMEGLRELKTTMFDLVLCDFLMPVMDGLDCCQQYREWEGANRKFFKQYIVGISAHASHNDIERGLKLGMDDFKPKPIVLKTLTGLHESAALRKVRSRLDELLNIPKVESAGVIEANRHRELEMKLSEVAGTIPGSSDERKQNGADPSGSLQSGEAPENLEPASKKPRTDGDNGRLDK